jgi:F-type H+-transporting ATPase subunit epsilon
VCERIGHNYMKLELVTLNGLKLGEDVYEVVLPTSDGTVAVFPGHMPVVTLAVPGVISVRPQRTTPDDDMEHYATNGGVIEIGNDFVRVLVDEADHADEIVASEAEEALKHAQQLKAEAKDQVTLEHAQSLIDRQAVRLKVAELRRHRHKRM